MSLNNLMTLFKFNHQDLEANRQGRLSAEQQKRWQGAGQFSSMITQVVIPLVVAGFIVVLGLVVGFIIDNLVLGGLIGLVLGAVVGGGIGLMAWNNGRNKSETASVAVGRAEGVAHLKEVHDRGEPGMSFHRYLIEIEHHTFQLFRKEQFEALENGGRYIVYYLDNEEKYIVSLEPVT